MKNLIFTLTFSFLVSVIYAQTIDNTDDVVKKYNSYHYHKGEKTLSGGGFHSGGFGALSFKAGEFRDKALMMAGVRGGWIINSTVALGIEAYGVIPSTEYSDIYFYNDVVLLGGYGGLFIEPIIFSDEVVHVTFPIASGAGWLGYHDDLDGNDDTDDDLDDLIDDDVFWYLEPGVTAEVNVTRNFRLALGVTKRFTKDMDLLLTKSSDFESLNYVITFKFGAF
ncbi:hypothetical protein LVD15_05205 [Fulvivirga maritima]|uniref:hypothetical protein n=1 Tax=Fulvivirga maritima TaxID=2904247 RepID=UPI001F373D05|nr:hypothetical protein [Fulvivirga maritima]UII27822.1 hypothetical protein LVD15_05205 [Fulvivirga maritima]